MAMLEELGCGDIIAERVRDGFTHQQIAEELHHLYPNLPGLSSRSVRRFCCNNNIHHSCHLSSAEVDEVVEQSVAQVGPSYGRRTLNGLLRSEGIVIGEQRIRQSLLHVTPVYTVQRRNHTYRRINPTPYYAEYHGHKIHLDQNEKLLQFGVTHVAASDGYSGKLLGIITMPKKNNLLIYDELFRPIILEHGLWDQVRVDGGREFALIIHVQQALSSFRTNTQRTPYLQTPSTMNHRAERHWVEVNSRVNYPVKTALISMQQQNIIDMDSPTTKFCTSVIAGKLCQVGLKAHIQAWNSHRIPGRGIPDVLARENNRARQIHPSFVPSLDDARASYELNGGNLSAPANFGSDPLSGHQELILQRELFMQNNNPSPENIFAHVVNGSNTSFAHALQTMIDLTNHLSTQI